MFMIEEGSDSGGARRSQARLCAFSWTSGLGAGRSTLQVHRSGLVLPGPLFLPVCVSSGSHMLNVAVRMNIRGSMIR